MTTKTNYSLVAATMTETDKAIAYENTGMRKLRKIVALFAVCREDFNDRFTMPELEKLYDMFKACGWEIYPDQWTGRQIDEALKGKPPQWDENEAPKYAPRRVPVRKAKPRVRLYASPPRGFI